MHNLYPPMPNGTLSTSDMTSYLLKVQNKIANTLHQVHKQCSTDRYMCHLHTCTGENSDDFTSWLLSDEKVAKLTGN